jgi:hypothetical protein
MFEIVDDVMAELKRTLEAIGMVPFFTKAYFGKHIDGLSPFGVGVYAGYLPHKAAFFTCVFRFHGTGRDINQEFVYQIVSQHSAEKEISQITSTRIYDPKSRMRECGTIHMIPVYHLDGWFGHHCHKMGQSLVDADYPLPEKIAYTGDIFGSFIKMYGDTLLERFTEAVEPNVTPHWSQTLAEVKSGTILEGKTLDQYFWYLVLAGLDRFLEDPAFPLPPADI